VTAGKSSRFIINGERTAARRYILCGSSRYIAISQIDRGLFTSYLTFISIIKLFKQVREVGHQGICAI